MSHQEPAKPVTAEAMDYAFARVFGDEFGELVLKDLRATCFMDDSTFDPERPLMTAFREGQRNVMLYILSRMQRAGKPQHLPRQAITEEG